MNSETYIHNNTVKTHHGRHTHSESKYQNQTIRSQPFGPYHSRIMPKYCRKKLQGHCQNNPNFPSRNKNPPPQFWIERKLHPGKQQRGKWPRGRSAAAQERRKQGRGGNPEKRKQCAQPGRENKGEGTRVGGIRPLQPNRNFHQEIPDDTTYTKSSPPPHTHTHTTSTYRVSTTELYTFKNRDNKCCVLWTSHPNRLIVKLSKICFKLLGWLLLSGASARCHFWKWLLHNGKVGVFCR
jgi:hypothetical protein